MRHWSRAANRRAGANLHAQEVRGKHTGKQWREGDWWTECQRCGFDVLGSELVEDGYRKGLLVCPKCKDLPHPQDYIRLPPEQLTPSGPTTGVSASDTDTSGQPTDPNIQPAGLTSTDETL